MASRFTVTGCPVKDYQSPMKDYYRLESFPTYFP